MTIFVKNPAAENELQCLFKGTERQTLWGILNPEFDGSGLGVTLDAFVSEEGWVPLRYHEAQDFWVKNHGSSRACMNYVFKLYGSKDRQDEQLKLIGAFTHALKHDWDQHHMACRVMGDDIYNKGCVRTLIYRVYKNVEGECQGHPEMLAGAPLGMCHCDVCGEMVMAGMPHPTEADIERAEQEMMEQSMAQQAREKEEWFQKVWAKVETEYVAYGKLEDGWFEDLPAPLPDSLKLAREFVEYVRENLAVHSRDRVLPALDHEGYVGIFMPNNDVNPVWWSCSFYPDETVTYRHEKGRGEHGEIVKIPQGPEHNAQLLALIHKL
jgi:hypothetical protein|uniref:Uncharacterized protein n=1 Tax=Myoviridae sp. ctshb19 TaxID=2825194 RepID=A0A8S5UGD6_9CAUD|nr:MAG TPA: hypothetical protein [Myoviridae sp. ctshb19]